LEAVLEALLVFHVGTWDYARPYIAHGYAANATVVQEKQKGSDLCGGIGVAVSPMTAAFAEAIGMAEPYGAIFDQPKAGSPAANAGIEAGDVLTAINGSAALAHQHTRRPRRTAQGTLVIDEFVAAAWAKTLPLAGTAIVGDVPIKPTPIIARTAITVIFMAHLLFDLLVGPHHCALNIPFDQLRRAAT
jgi:hypothetical protein